MGIAVLSCSFYTCPSSTHSSRWSTQSLHYKLNRNRWASVLLTEIQTSSNRNHMAMFTFMKLWHPKLEKGAKWCSHKIPAAPKAGSHSVVARRGQRFNVRRVQFRETTFLISNGNVLFPHPRFWFFPLTSGHPSSSILNCNSGTFVFIKF